MMRELLEEYIKAHSKDGWCTECHSRTRAGVRHHSWCFAGRFERELATSDAIEIAELFRAPEQIGPECFGGTDFPEVLSEITVGA